METTIEKLLNSKILVLSTNTTTPIILIGSILLGVLVANFMYYCNTAYTRITTPKRVGFVFVSTKAQSGKGTAISCPMANQKMEKLEHQSLPRKLTPIEQKCVLRRLFANVQCFNGITVILVRIDNDTALSKDTIVSLLRLALVTNHTCIDDVDIMIC